MTSDDIVKIARSWLGVPFIHQGRSRNGCDCVGPLLDIAEQAGIDVVDDRRYGIDPFGYYLGKVLGDKLEEIPKDSIKPGDVLFMRFARIPQHVAIVGDYPGGKLSMIHAYDRIGRVVEHRLSSVWTAKIHKAFRFKGV